MIMENSVQWLAGETEELGENLPQCRFVHPKPHMLPVREPGPPRVAIITKVSVYLGDAKFQTREFVLRLWEFQYILLPRE
jgi:hypothetical protein